MKLLHPQVKPLENQNGSSPRVLPSLSMTESHLLLRKAWDKNGIKTKAQQVMSPTLEFLELTQHEAIACTLTIGLGLVEISGSRPGMALLLNPQGGSEPRPLGQDSLLSSNPGPARGSHVCTDAGPFCFRHRWGQAFSVLIIQSLFPTEAHSVHRARAEDSSPQCMHIRPLLAS